MDRLVDGDLLEQAMFQLKSPGAVTMSLLALPNPVPPAPAAVQGAAGAANEL